ncbi:MAG: hypothetical protein KDI36_19335, partial [Pseudomonadales bacterium]|nr:hypothetical protein [Pseudomonadales bacterium]
QISDIEATEGELSFRLIDPLISLAEVQGQLGDHTSARETALRAQHLLHRRDGVLTAEQNRVLDLLIELDLKDNEPWAANRLMSFKKHLADRNWPESPELIVAWQELASWYQDTGQYRSARKVLEDIEAVYDEHPPADPDRLIDLYQRLAVIRRLEGSCCSYKYLETARDKLAGTELGQDQKLRLYSLLGDAYLLSQRDEQALMAYQTVSNDFPDAFASPAMPQQFELLYPRPANNKTFVRDEGRINVNLRLALQHPEHPDSGLKEVSEREFMQLPDLIPQGFLLPGHERDYQLKIDDNYNNITEQRVHRLVGFPYQYYYDQVIEALPFDQQTPESVNDLQLVLQFSVDERGHAEDVECLTDDVPPRLRKTLITSIRRTQFRPAFENGRPVKTDDMTLTQSFRIQQGKPQDR